MEHMEHAQKHSLAEGKAGHGTWHCDPLGDGVSSVDLVRASGSDLDVVNAARVSFGKMKSKLSERDHKLIHFLMMHNHTSPFEHNQMSFRIKAPMFVARQWMRHRMNSYNEISYRYVVAPLEFYTPPHWRYQATKNKQGSHGSFESDICDRAYQRAIDEAMCAYQELLDAGVAREQARAVLPLCTYTQYIYTCNLHAFLHFINLRIRSDAQFEIRQYAYAMLSMAYVYFPISIATFLEKHDLQECVQTT